MQREDDLPIPDGTPGHPPPHAPKPPREPGRVVAFEPGGDRLSELVENRLAEGKFFNGPSATGFA